MGCNIVNLFSNSVAIIKVGAATETELKEKKLRIEDALNATRSALQNATSVAAMFLTTEAVVADKPEAAGAAGMPDMGGMGGMGGMM